MAELKHYRQQIREAYEDTINNIAKNKQNLIQTVEVHDPYKQDFGDLERGAVILLMTSTDELNTDGAQYENERLVTLDCTIFMKLDIDEADYLTGLITNAVHTDPSMGIGLLDSRLVNTRILDNYYDSELHVIQMEFEVCLVVAETDVFTIDC